MYYGDEAGVCGWTDPDSRRTFPWGREHKDCLKFHKDIIAIHRNYEALRTGSVKILIARQGIFAYGRFKDNEIIAVVFNNNEYEQELTLPVWELGVSNNELMVRLLYTNSDFYAMDAKVYHNENGYVRLKMPRQSAIILKNIPTEV